MKIAIFEYTIIKPFRALGLTGSFWNIHIDTLIYSWVAMLIIFSLVILGRAFLKKNPNLVSMGFEKVIGFFMDLCEESFKKFNYYYFAFVSTLFFFTLFCCLVGILPFLDESTKDLNTTLALGLTSFCYVQYQKIKIHGLLGYLKEFTHPFFLLAPVNIVGELAKIASMSFRLFGNILGGGVIFTMLVEFLGEYKMFFSYT